MTIVSGKGTHHSIEAGDEEHSRNDADGGSESAMRAHRFGRIEVYGPALHAVGETHSGDSASTHGEVGILFIRGAAEDDLAAADIGLPYERAFLVWIMRPNHSRLLSGDHEALAIRQVCKNGAGGKIPVGIRLRVGAVVGVRHRGTSWTATAASGECAASACIGSTPGRSRRKSGGRRTLRTAGVPDVARLVLLDPENFA